jgi:hypothetical protein
MNELYGISYVLIRHPSRLQYIYIYIYIKFIVDGLFMVKGAAIAPSLPAKSRGRPPKEIPLVIEAMSRKEKEKADKAKDKPDKPAEKQRVKQRAVPRPVDHAAQEALAAALEEQARDELAGIEDSLNDKTPPPSPGRRTTAADRQQVNKEAKEADQRARLAAEVEQLKSQLEKEKKRRQSVAEPTQKRAKPSAAASRKKLVKIDGLFVHRLHHYTKVI